MHKPSPAASREAPSRGALSSKPSTTALYISAEEGLSKQATVYCEEEARQKLSITSVSCIRLRRRGGAQLPSKTPTIDELGNGSCAYRWPDWISLWQATGGTERGQLIVDGNLPTALFLRIDLTRRITKRSESINITAGNQLRPLALRLERTYRVL